MQACIKQVAECIVGPLGYVLVPPSTDLAQQPADASSDAKQLDISLTFRWKEKIFSELLPHRDDARRAWASVKVHRHMFI